MRHNFFPLVEIKNLTLVELHNENILGMAEGHGKRLSRMKTDFRR
jgi:hypothetical protein